MAGGIADVAVAENAQAGDGQRDEQRVVGEKTNDGIGKDDEEDADGAEKDHGVKAGAPDGSFRALGLLGAEVLADERGGGVAEAPARQDDKNEYANGDGIAGEGCGAEDADDADEANPTGVSDGELQNAGERDAEQAHQDTQVDAKLVTENADAHSPSDRKSTRLNSSHT